MQTTVVVTNRPLTRRNDRTRDRIVSGHSHHVHVPPAPRVTIHEESVSTLLTSERTQEETGIIFHLFQNVTKMQQFYRFLHFLVTLIFSLLISFQYYFKLTKRKIRGIFYNSPECDIKNGVATLKVLPRHLTFIVMEKNIDLGILARIVVWSITAGISYISIQASEGDLEERKTEFYGEIYQIRQEMSSCDYELHFEDKDSAEQNGVNGTGHKNVRKVHVNILSYHEGKEDITKAAQKFCTRVKNKEAQSKTMNIEQLSQLLEVHKDFPDPDLAITFGGRDSICDYPPWHIRLTEFISVSSLRVMDHTLFLQTLWQYSKCEQRIGR